MHIAFQWCGIHSVSIALSGQYEWWTNTVLLRCYNERSLSYCHHLDVSNGKMVTCDLSTACFELLRDILSEEHQAEGSFVSQNVPAFGHLCECMGFWEGRTGCSHIRVCLFHCCHYIPFGVVLLMRFAVGGLWRWILRNEGSLICFPSRWCWGSKVTRCRAAFHCNLFATNAFTL